MLAAATLVALLTPAAEAGCKVETKRDFDGNERVTLKGWKWASFWGDLALERTAEGVLWHVPLRKNGVVESSISAAAVIKFRLTDGTTLAFPSATDVLAVHRTTDIVFTTWDTTVALTKSDLQSLANAPLAAVLIPLDSGPVERDIRPSGPLASKTLKMMKCWMKSSS